MVCGGGNAELSMLVWASSLHCPCESGMWRGKHDYKARWVQECHPRHVAWFLEKLYVCPLDEQCSHLQSARPKEEDQRNVWVTIRCVTCCQGDLCYYWGLVPSHKSIEYTWDETGMWWDTHCMQLQMSHMWCSVSDLATNRKLWLSIFIVQKSLSIELGNTLVG